MLSRVCLMEHLLDLEEHQVDPTEHPLDAAEHHLDLPEHRVDPAEHQVHPEEFRLDPEPRLIDLARCRLEMARPNSSASLSRRDGRRLPGVALHPWKAWTTTYSPAIVFPPQRGRRGSLTPLG
jgi:hypothetical protein